MKISANLVRGTFATIVYFGALIMIWLELSEPAKSFMGSEEGAFWVSAILYAFTLFLAVSMPIFSVFDAVGMYKSKQFSRGDSLFMACIGIVITAIAYPLVAHAIATVAQHGTDITQLKIAIRVMLDTKNLIAGWEQIYFMAGLFIYGMTATLILVFGLCFGTLFAVLFGWTKAIELVVD